MVADTWSTKTMKPRAERKKGREEGGEQDQRVVGIRSALVRAKAMWLVLPSIYLQINTETIE